MVKFAQDRLIRMPPTSSSTYRNPDHQKYSTVACIGRLNMKNGSILYRWPASHIISWSNNMIPPQLACVILLFVLLPNKY